MSARAIINTPREDREGDIIVPQGVQLENYCKNPVVLWEHGLGEITRPIAKCQLPNGELALEVEDEQISAISFFTDKCLESLQIFHLIAEGLVRATSVRALPIKSSVRKTSNSGVGIILEKWELIEWSWGALGVNPDAIARTIDRGTIEGRKITNPLLKSLKAVLPTEKTTVPGWSATETSKTDQCFKQIQPDSTNRQTKSMPADFHGVEIKDAENPCSEKPSISTKSDNRHSSDTVVPSLTDIDNASDQRLPLGAQIIRSILGSLQNLKQRVKSTNDILENDQVKRHLTSLLESLDTEQHHLEKLFSENYTHLKHIVHSEQSSPFNTYELPNPNRLPIDQSQLLAEFIKLLKQDAIESTTSKTTDLERDVEQLSQSIKALQRKIVDLFPAR